MELTNQAFTVLGLNVIQLLAVIVFILMSRMTNSMKIVWIVSAIISIGVGALLIIGVINCMVMGGCANFAWLIVGLLIVYFVIALVATIALSMSGKNVLMMPKSVLADPLTAQKTDIVEEKRRRRRVRFDDDEDDEDKPRRSNRRNRDDEDEEEDD
jgi:hypothetical protein